MQWWKVLQFTVTDIRVTYLLFFSKSKMPKKLVVIAGKMPLLAFGDRKVIQIRQRDGEVYFALSNEVFFLSVSRTLVFIHQSLYIYKIAFNKWLLK